MCHRGLSVPSSWIRFSNFLGGVLGQWWLFTVLLVAAAFFYSYGVPRAKARVFAHGDLAPKLLDEHVPTWRPHDALTLLAGLGVPGRRALQNFYLKMDLWFPGPTICLAYCALLSLAFPSGSPLGLLNLLAVPALLFDVAENVNHLIMARRYPDLPFLSLRLGPAFTLLKWAFAMLLPVIAVAGLIARQR
jgi:hypothetical protein